jgi:metallo-beta-lactamase family protein
MISNTSIKLWSAAPLFRAFAAQHRVLIVFAIMMFRFCQQAISTEPTPPYIQFLGSAQMIGGSCYLIDTGKTRLLVDCGLYYGNEYKDRNGSFDFKPETIDFVLLTHAHIDHAGRIPLLYKEGFNGKTIGTDATRSIAGVMLEMSMSIAKKEGASLFSFKDYAEFMKKYEAIKYDQLTELTPDVSVRLQDAGHILGSSIIEIWIKTSSKPIKLVVAADLGAKGTVLLKDPVEIKEADYVFVEATYGSVIREPADYHDFGIAIRDTLRKGGSVLVPAFVLEKTQKVLYTISQLQRENIIPYNTPVYTDSATASEITRIYRAYTNYYDAQSLKLLNQSIDPFRPSGHLGSKSSEINTPSIYVTSSGMLDYGNAPRHLERMISDPKNLLLIVGWQSPESLGRKLQNGEPFVTIRIEENILGKIIVRNVTKAVKMKVKKCPGFSSHADGAGVEQWLSHFKTLRKVFVVHGDRDNTIGLARTIHDKLGFIAVAPELGEVVQVSNSDVARTIKNSYCYSNDVYSSISNFFESGGYIDQ